MGPFGALVGIYLMTVLPTEMVTRQVQGGRLRRTGWPVSLVYGLVVLWLAPVFFPFLPGMVSCQSVRRFNLRCV